jgi:hypothetical protein
VCVCVCVCVCIRRPMRTCMQPWRAFSEVKQSSWAETELSCPNWFQLTAFVSRGHAPAICLVIFFIFILNSFLELGGLKNNKLLKWLSMLSGSTRPNFPCDML